MAFLFIQMKDIHSTVRLDEFSKGCNKEVSKAEVDEGKKNGTLMFWNLSVPA